MWLELLKVVHHLPSLVAIDYGSGYVMFSVFHMILQNCMIKGLCGLVGGSPSWYVTSLPSLVVIGIVVVEF